MTIYLPPTTILKVDKRKFIRRRTSALWAPTWCRLVGHNIFACMRDTREGVRDPNARGKAAKVGSRYQLEERTASADRNVVCAQPIGASSSELTRTKIPWGRPHKAPVESDVPRRLPNFWNMPTSDTAGDPGEIPKMPAQVGTNSRWQWFWPKTAPPVESDLPRRRHVQSFTGTSSTRGDDDESHKSQQANAAGSWWGWMGRGPVESGAPRRHPNYVASSGSSSGLAVDVKIRGFGEGESRRGWWRTGHVESDLPRRRSMQSFASTMSSAGDSDESHQAIEYDSRRGTWRWGWKGTGPEESDVPRRHADYAGASPCDSPPQQEETIARASRQRGWRRTGPLESDLPRRRSMQSFASTMSSVGGVDDSPGASRATQFDSSQGGRWRWGTGPEESDVPRRHADYAGASPCDSPPQQEETIARASRQRGWRRTGPLESDLPRRRSMQSFASTMSSAGGVDDSPGASRATQFDSSQGGMWRWGTGPEESDVPRRHADYAGASQSDNPSERGVSSQFKSTVVGSARRGWRRNGPVESDLPRRRSVESFASTVTSTGAHQASEYDDSVRGAWRHGLGVPHRDVDYSGSASPSDSPSEQEHGLGSASRGGMRRRGWKKTGPFESDLPRRRTVHSFTSTLDTASLTDFQSSTDDEERGTSPWQVESRGGWISQRPVETNLPHRRSTSVFSAPFASHASSPEVSNIIRPEVVTGSAPGLGGESEPRLGDYSVHSAFPGLGRRPEGDTAGDASTDLNSGLFGLPWGFPGRAPIAVDLPRRVSGYSAQGLQAIDGQGGDSSQDADRFDGKVASSFQAYKISSENMRLMRKPALGHVPIQVDIPRRRSTEFSLSEKDITFLRDDVDGADIPTSQSGMENAGATKIEEPPTSDVLACHTDIRG